MKLNSATSIFNMGDTSIRVKQTVEVNKMILEHLADFMKSGLSWNDKYIQQKFYDAFIERINELEDNLGSKDGKLFSDFSREIRVPDADKIGLRGRTLTNAIIKVGFINSKRQLSQVGLAYLKNRIKPADEVEKLLGLDDNNLAYFRQYLKLRIYAHDSNAYFHNFRFAMAFLVKYDDVPKKDFLSILEAINPNFSKVELNELIQKYALVNEGKQSFEVYFNNHFSKTVINHEELAKARQVFAEQNFSDENISRLFPNRKSSSNDVYKDFIVNLINLVDNQDKEAFEAIKTLSKDSQIKKAFSKDRLPFLFDKKETVEEFLDNNADNPLLDTDHFQIYQQFVLSKRKDLIREYSDMCRRAFQVTGIINFDNGLVNLNSKWLIKPLLELIAKDNQFSLSGKSDYQQYENNEDSLWYQDLTLCEILSIQPNDIHTLKDNLKIEFSLENIDNIAQTIDERRESEYLIFVKEKFSKEIIIEILQHINTRNDKEVYKLVTDNATVSTIYEYILTIAWYYMLRKKKGFMLHKAFQVSLDGNKLPLTHRGGGAGDIELITDDYAVLLEVTLMDANTQKRGELEPVIRHSTNFAVHQNNIDNAKPVQSIFIANQLDANVINIFRATQFIQLAGTIEEGDVDGLNIFALTTTDVIRLLEKGVDDKELLDKLAKTQDKQPIRIENNWHQKVIKQIFHD